MLLNLILFLLTFCSPLVFAESSVGVSSSDNLVIDNRQEATLVISLIDGLGFSQYHTDIIATYLENEDPSTDVISVTQRSSRLGLFEAATRSSLIKKLSEIDFSKYKIIRLVLNTHGSSYKLADGSDSRTSLASIGEFGELGPDEDFKGVFDPIIDNFSEDLVIVLNSCSTLCTSAEHRGKRIKALFDYFKTKKGQIYGANVTETGSYLFYSPYLKIKNFLPSLKLFSFLFAASPAFIAAPLDLFFGEVTLSRAVIAGTIFGLIPNIFLASVTRLNGRNNSSNWGFVYRFDGQTYEFKEINKTVSRFNIIYHDNSCAYFLD